MPDRIILAARLSTFRARDKFLTRRWNHKSENGEPSSFARATMAP